KNGKATVSSFDQLAGVRNQFCHQRTQCRDGRFFDFEKTFVLSEIPFLVGVVQNAPLNGRPTEGVGQALEQRPMARAPGRRSSQSRR
ncbi:MAG: hypothetical protein Q8R95_07650, partial [Azonexus sp.]|nr:hypothetical protein [Azonexus sp.]